MIPGWRPRVLLEPIDLSTAEFDFVSEEDLAERYWNPLTVEEQNWVHGIVGDVDCLVMRAAWLPAERRFWRRIILANCPSEAAALYLAVRFRVCPTFSRTLLVRDGVPGLHQDVSYMLQIFWPTEWDVAGESAKPPPS